MLLISFLLLLGGSRRHQYAFFEEVRCSDHSIGIEFAIIFDLLYTQKVFFRVLLRSNIWVSRTVVKGVSKLLTALASDLLCLLELLSILLLILFIFLFRLVSCKLATWSIFVGLTAAPPDLATIGTSVDATTPGKVIFLIVVLATILTDFLSDVKLAFLSLELLDSLAHLLTLNHKSLPLSFKLILSLKELVGLLSLRLQLSVKFQHALLKCLHRNRLLIFDLLFLFQQLLSELSIVVAISCSCLNILR